MNIPKLKKDVIDFLYMVYTFEKKKQGNKLLCKEHGTFHKYTKKV